MNKRSNNILWWILGIIILILCICCIYPICKKDNYENCGCEDKYDKEDTSYNIQNDFMTCCSSRCGYGDNGWEDCKNNHCKKQYDNCKNIKEKGYDCRADMCVGYVK